MAPVPDLLRRFAQIPQAVLLRGRDSDIRVETNDPEIADYLAATDAAERDCNFRGSWLWKVLRDEASSGYAEEYLSLSAGPLAVAFLAPNTVVMVDQDLRELLSFVGADFAIEVWYRQLLAVMAELSGRNLGVSSCR